MRGNSTKNIKKQIIMVFFLIVSATLFVFFFSRTTSPLYPTHVGYDSPIFETIGKYWARGVVPYIGLFDHKGPYIFFVNMLGYKIAGSSFGIFIIQIFFMTITIAAIYRIIALESEKVLQRILYTFFTVLVLTLLYDEGNLTEEYVLPFLCICAYGQLKYILKLQNEIKHPVLWGSFYGLTFAICFLTRITNAIGLLSGILAITIILLVKKQYKNILYNGVAFVAGFTVMILPFVVYFYMQGGFEDFYFGTIGFNLDYTENTIYWWEKGKFFMYLKIWIIRFFPVYGMIIPAFLAFKRKSNAKALWILIIAVTETIFFIQGNLYPHYVMIALTNFIVLLHELVLWRPKKNFVKQFFQIGIFLYVCIAFLYCVKDNIKAYRNVVHYVPEYNYLMEQIPTNEKNEFIAYQTDRNIYLQYDIKPCYPYFILQESQSRYSNRLKQNIYDTFYKGNAKWILVYENDNYIIQNILDSRYKQVDRTENYVLYNLSKKKD